MRESSIRTRLGRLPKGLAGVYDEIINSITSEDAGDSDLPIRALKWMLVSNRPLKPRELVAAAELDPSISIDNATESQESTLTVEPLIQSCGGLLLLDTKLDVVRFSHLSVQEYLETRNGKWDVTIIDAQLFVAESCLWTLQSPLESPLYRYAGYNWFKHCKSYQDLLLSTKNIADTKHELHIPLLNNFLGAFKESSASYVKWARFSAFAEGTAEDTTDSMVLGQWNYVYGVDSPCVVRGAPHYPAFSAAFAGLGELVSWLWNAETNDMRIRDERGTSLLQYASRHGTTWIVVEMLKGGAEIHDVQKALIQACGAGKLSITKLFLDRGLDVNVTDGSYGTALSAAAMVGNMDIVTLLLDRGADVNLTGGNYGSALVAAVLKENLDIITLLLDRGADVNLTGGVYGSALAAAASQSNLDIVTLLLDRGADVNLTDGAYGSALAADRKSVV